MHSNSYSLKALNTFGIDVEAEKITFIRSVEDLHNAIHISNGPFAVLGGGSNILFTQNPEKHLLVNRIKGIKVLEEDSDKALIKVGGGEVWHDLVEWAIKKKLGGIENLSLIPGTVGAAPIQNIGAYGVEQESVFHSLEAINFDSGKTIVFSHEDCRFGYRDSVFKNELKGKVFITSVNYILQKNPKLYLEYGAITEEMKRLQIDQPTIADVSKVVIKIRRSKLPDPAIIGNGGSFFKNPIISKEKYAILQKKNPSIPAYPVDENWVKIPAGWLIDKGGWKGYRKNQVGTHERQALVIVNYGGATGKEIWDFAQEIIEKVLNRYSISLEPEVNIW